MKKTTGFYLSAISAVLTLACIFLYGKVLFTSSYVRPLLIVRSSCIEAFASK